MIVAVVGSRCGVERGRVERWVEKLAEKHPAAIVLSTSDVGVAQVAERAAERRGLRVASLRPESWVRYASPKRPSRVFVRDWENLTLEEEELLEQKRLAEREYDRLIREALMQFVVVLYETEPGATTRSRPLEKIHGSFEAAVAARDTLLAELADRAVVFESGPSPETAFLVSEFQRLGKIEFVTQLAA